MSSPYFLTNYGKDLLHGHLWRTATMSKPTAIWWAAFTVAPTEVAGSGTEVAALYGYARVQLNAADASYAAPASSADSGRYITNSAVVQFPNCSGGDFGNIVALARMDASTVGNMLGWFLLASPFYVRNGEIGPTLPAGAFTFAFP